MNAPTLPTPTLDELIHRAIEDHDAVGKIARIAHLQPERERQIAAEAVTAAVDDWCFENRCDWEAVPVPLVALAYQRVLAAGIEAREASQQGDLFLTREITDGAAQCEARRELAGE